MRPNAERAVEQNRPPLVPEAASPCVGVCLLDAGTGLCRGCLRTMAEIASWPTLDLAEKRRVLAQLPERSALTDPAMPP